MMVSTSEFRISQGRFLTVMARCIGRGWFISLAVVALGCIIAGILWDLRFIILALMIILLVLPMIVTMIYFHFGLRPEGFVNTLPHIVTFSEDALSVEVFFPVYRDKEIDEEESEDAQELPHRTYTFSLRKPVRYIAGTSALIIPVGNPRRGMIIVPYNSFADKESLKMAVDCLIK